ncbi:MAG: hypothetical protein M3O88_00900 [Actinomycetota bacterium]|nr:hypothetical protein [Actinomycetota bacterium]
MNRKLVKIYLNDHLAGSVVGRELAKRCLANNRDTPLGRYLETFLEQQAEDQETLQRVMRRLRVRRTRWKLAAAWGAERVGRIKLNGRISSYSPLSRLIELEGLLLGVEGKRAAWSSLRYLGLQPLAGLDLDALIRRSEDQQARFERFRLQAASEALA